MRDDPVRLILVRVVRNTDTIAAFGNRKAAVKQATCLQRHQGLALNDQAQKPILGPVGQPATIGVDLGRLGPHGGENDDFLRRSLNHASQSADGHIVLDQRFCLISGGILAPPSLHRAEADSFCCHLSQASPASLSGPNWSPFDVSQVQIGDDLPQPLAQRVLIRYQPVEMFA